MEGEHPPLEHEIERAVILTDDGELIDVDALSMQSSGPGMGQDDAPGTVLELVR